MSTELFPHYRRFVDRRLPVNVRPAYRLVPDYPVPLSVKRKANYEQWRSFGFDQTEADNLGTTLFSADDYTIISQVKNSTITDYDIMFICFPNGQKPICHLPTELSTVVRKNFYQALSTGAQTVADQAKQDGQILRRIYVHQHVGPNELNDAPFNISFPQMHMHVIGVTEADIDASQKGMPRQHLIRGGDRNTFTDPTILIARDILKRKLGISAEIDFSTSSLIIHEKPLSLEISEQEQELLISIYHHWVQELGMMDLVYTQMELIDKHSDSRSLPASPELIKDMFDFLQKKAYFLSEESWAILAYLAENITAGNPEKPMNNFYKGIAGSVGWTHDFDTGKSTLRFAPRTFVSAQKLGCSDGFYMGIKDKSSYLSDKDSRLTVQRRIFSQLRENFIPVTALIPQPKIVPVNSFEDLLAAATIKKFYREIYFTEDYVYKNKQRFTPEQITENYHLLLQSGMAIGKEPEFIKNPEGETLQRDPVVGSTNGADFLSEASTQESIDFFEQTILRALGKLMAAQDNPSILSYAIDALPHNFVLDDQTGEFKFIDYEPDYLTRAHAHFKVPYRLLNYALVKFGREKPDLFFAALDKVKAFLLDHPEIGTEPFDSQPHLQLAMALQNNNYQKAKEVLTNYPLQKDEILGMLIVVANFLDFSDNKVQEKLQIILNSVGIPSPAEYSIHSFVHTLAYAVGKNNPEKLRDLLIEIFVGFVDCLIYI